MSLRRAFNRIVARRRNLYGANEETAGYGPHSGLCTAVRNTYKQEGHVHDHAALAEDNPMNSGDNFEY